MGTQTTFKRDLSLRTLLDSTVSLVKQICKPVCLLVSLSVAVSFSSLDTRAYII